MDRYEYYFNVNLNVVRVIIHELNHALQFKRMNSNINNEEKETNFCEWINSFRVEYAKDIMKESSNADLTMVSIAERSGFSSRSVFYRAFKQREGLTPGEYKQRLHL